jgi:hypothetical protein
MAKELKCVQIEHLKEFAREIVSKMFDEGYNLDEGDIQEIAEKHKIIRWQKAPKNYADEWGCDYWYTFPKWLKEENEDK